ncbi:PaaI family thioesterase [Peptoniphilus catoniae]|uniref:PaaI family thioesterase n=1 Tax=Peptoniphilus catoniae TaxID=1660341 RepID=UPI0010FDE49E|nr:PaaI family thioesterase [Peptoniphilus catoniae]
MGKYDKYIRAQNEDSRYAIHLGIKTTEIREGYGKVEVDLVEDHFNPVGSVHGGLIFSLADIAAGSASVSYGTGTATVASNLNFVSAAVNSHRIIAEAKVIKRGKKILVIDVKVYDDKEKLLATGTFTYYNLGEPFGKE